MPNNVFKFAPFGRRTSLSLGRLTQRSRDVGENPYTCVVLFGISTYLGDKKCFTYHFAHVSGEARS